MSHLSLAHKLGATAAVDDFTAWLQNDDGNPTDYPKRRGAILKTAQGNPMQPNAGVMAPAPQPQPTQGAGGAVGMPTSGSGGAAPVTPPPAAGGGGKIAAVIAKLAAPLIGGSTRQAQDLAREGVFGVGKPVPPPQPPPATSKPMSTPASNIKSGADLAVEKVMRKLGKSTSRRPLGRDGTKYDALKKKLRKQKPKKD